MASAELQAALAPQADDFKTLVKAEKVWRGVWKHSASAGLMVRTEAVLADLDVHLTIRSVLFPPTPRQVSIVEGGEAPEASAVTIVNDQTQVRE